MRTTFAVVMDKKSCAVCGVKTGIKQCGRCKRVCYCCKEHQIYDWKIHKSLCKPVSAGTADPSTLALDDVRIDCRSYKDFVSLGDCIHKSMQKYSLCVLDGFLEESKGNLILAEVKRLRQAGRMAPGQLSGGSIGSDNSMKFTDKSVRGDEIVWLEGCEEGCSSICLLMTAMDELVVYSNRSGKLPGCKIHGRTKAMVACYPGDQTGYSRHVDNPDGDGRCLTALYYLNSGWDEKHDGGSLRVFSPSGGIQIDIQPEMNRLLLFWSDKRNPHEVLPSFRERYAITVWYFDQEQRQLAKVSHYQEMALLTSRQQSVFETVVQKKAQKDAAESELHRKSADVIRNMLSEDDIEALSTLVRKHPDDWQEIFDNMSIAPSIQKAFIDLLVLKS